MAEHSTSSTVAVVIPAAGRGTRLGGSPKQFRPLGDRPVLFQTLGVFEAHPAVHHLVVAVSREHVAEVSDRAESYGLTKLAGVVEGGASRQASVGRALTALPPTVDIVLVHDAVRPFVQGPTVTAVIEATQAHGAAAPAIPVVDTLRSGRDGWFGETVPRERLFRMQTPQGFRRAWLEAAHREAGSDRPATDDVELVQRLGHRVRVVPGHAHNIKITTREDWQLAQLLLAEKDSINH